VFLRHCIGFGILFDHILQRHALQHAVNRLLDLGENRMRRAETRVLAPFAAHAVRDGGGAFQRVEDFADGDFRTGAGKLVSPHGAPAADHKAGAPERGEELFEVCFGNILPLGDGLERHRPVLVDGQVVHRPQSISAAG